MSNEDEHILIQKAKSDPAAFGILYERNYANIFGYVQRRVLNWEIAQDITAEVFVKAYVNIWKFQWKNISISAWFYRIATNEVNMYFRKGTYQAVSLDDLNKGFDLPDPQSLTQEKDNAERELQQYQDFIVIQSRITHLPIKYQEVIALKYFEQKGTKEISEILGKSEGTVKSLIFRALEKMRNLI